MDESSFVTAASKLNDSPDTCILLSSYIVYCLSLALFLKYLVKISFSQEITHAVSLESLV